ncbi:flagellar hook-length control protein FliK [Aliiruegeria sabulilitoris]|uniref:flagellar hook-length control protein FliK n=1 Tax=Aliiruegeria sabulilitoris TaxID=1510458 RepID=UPI0009E69D73|nr:flagellar hook-length control protein FliK [Aliiruegeria sabulilitoris]NDR57889.1 hypothetical protein [Pseudoruegeria sp. M32A2M]
MHPAQSISLVTSPTSQTGRKTCQHTESTDISFADHLSALQGGTNHSSKAGETESIPFGSPEGGEALAVTETPTAKSSDQTNRFADSDDLLNKDREELPEPATETGTADTTAPERPNLPVVERSVADLAAKSVQSGEQPKDLLALNATDRTDTEGTDAGKSVKGIRSEDVEGENAAAPDKAGRGVFPMPPTQDGWPAQRMPSEGPADETSAASPGSQLVEQKVSFSQFRGNQNAVATTRFPEADAREGDSGRSIPNGSLKQTDAVSLVSATGASAAGTSVPNLSNDPGMPLTPPGGNTPSGLAGETTDKARPLLQDISSRSTEGTQSQQPSVALRGAPAPSASRQRVVVQSQPDAIGTMTASNSGRFASTQPIRPDGMSLPIGDLSQADRSAPEMSELGLQVPIPSRTSTSTSEEAFDRASLAQQVQFHRKVSARPQVSMSPSQPAAFQAAMEQDASAAVQGRYGMEGLNAQAVKAEILRQNLVPEMPIAASSIVQQPQQGQWFEASGELVGQPDSPSFSKADSEENEHRSAPDAPPRVHQRSVSRSDAQNGTTPASIAGGFSPAKVESDLSIAAEQEFETVPELDLSEVFSDRGREGVGTTTVRQSDTSSAALRTASRSLAETISDRVQVTSRESFDVRLSPEELGNLRISFINAESGLSVNIHADRPETLELFRRNIEVLSADLRALGYEDVSMSFAEGRSEGGDHPGT